MRARINKFVAQATGISRREADKRVASGKVSLNGRLALVGDNVGPDDKVMMDGKKLTPSLTITIKLNKPAGYVSSRQGQGSQTIYDLLPDKYHSLKPVGRLDKDSSGLMLLTNDGDLAQRLTHPSNKKYKIYELKLNRALEYSHYQQINREGILLEDGLSKLSLSKVGRDGKQWIVKMHEGRNRQIRRTFEALSYRVVNLHRTSLGEYNLGSLLEGKFQEL